MLFLFRKYLNIFLVYNLDNNIFNLDKTTCNLGNTKQSHRIINYFWVLIEYHMQVIV